jgi:hypothetical protein
MLHDNVYVFGDLQDPNILDSPSTREDLGT